MGGEEEGAEPRRGPRKRARLTAVVEAGHSAGMGRREKYPLDMMAEALRRSKGLRSQAAKILDCSVQTVSGYVKRHKELQQIERDVLDYNLDVAENQLMKNIKDGKEPSLFFFLKCKGRERGWQDRQVVETTGADGAAIQHVHKVVTPRDFKTMSDEDLADFIRGECGSSPD